MSEAELPPGYRPMERKDNRPGAAKGKKKRGPTDARGIMEAVDRINRRHGVVLVGGKAVILRESLDAQGRPDIALMSQAAFELWFANEKVQVNGAMISIAPIWLNSPKRQQYRGICFAPEGLKEDDGSGETAPWYNLWKGFAYQPDKDAGKFNIWLDHLKMNVAQGNSEHYEWLLDWFAHMFQKPTERIGTSLVFRGEQGTGKTIVGKTVGKLLGLHYMLIDSPHYLTGNFNAHMKAVILLQADEGFWAGNKEAEGRLKGLITSDYQMIEAKNVDAVAMRNLIRLMISSNNDWVVPAGMGERRFAVFDMGEGVMQNREYFAEMEEQLEAGGYAALLHFFLTREIKGNPAVIPKTAALLEQKIESLNHEAAYWFEALRRGSPFDGASKWLTEIPKHRMYKAYIAHAELVGVKRRAIETRFGQQLGKFVPDLKDTRPYVAILDDQGVEVGKRREWCWVVPDLRTCREAFEKKLGQSVDWGEDGADSGGDAAEQGSESEAL